MHILEYYVSRIENSYAPENKRFADVGLLQDLHWDHRGGLQASLNRGPKTYASRCSQKHNSEQLHYSERFEVKIISSNLLARARLSGNRVLHKLQDQLFRITAQYSIFDLMECR